MTELTQFPDWPQIETVLRSANVCHLAMLSGQEPYIVPLTYGYEQNALFIHSAPRGHKLQILSQNPRVCFSVQNPVQLLPADSPCKFSVRYASVLGQGKAVRLNEFAEKQAALDIIVRQCGGVPAVYSQSQLQAVAIIQILIESASYKAHPL